MAFRAGRRRGRPSVPDARQRSRHHRNTLNNVHLSEGPTVLLISSKQTKLAWKAHGCMLCNGGAPATQDRPRVDWTSHAARLKNTKDAVAPRRPALRKAMRREWVTEAMWRRRGGSGWATPRQRGVCFRRASAALPPCFRGFFVTFWENGTIAKTVRKSFKGLSSHMELQ